MCVCVRARVHMFVGDHAFCMMDSHGQESNPLVIMGALDLVVWVCAQGNCRRCIVTLHAGYVCVCVCARARMHMFVGDHAFCMMDSHG